MLNIAIYDTSGTMKRVTKRCNLFCSIDAKPVESGEYFYFLLKQNLYMLRVLLAQDKLGLQQVTSLSSMAWLPYDFIQSEVSITQLAAAFICCTTGLNVGGKTRNTGFHFLHVLL